MPSVFWTDGDGVPPRASNQSSAGSPCPKVWCCPADSQPHYVRFIQQPIAVWVHWLPSVGRSLPCLGHNCHHCEDYNEAVRVQHWKGYAPAMIWQRDQSADSDRRGGSWVEKVCELTGYAIDQIGIDAPLKVSEGTRQILWRGLIVELRRGDRRRSGRLMARCLFDREVKEPLPLPRSVDEVKAALQRMWTIRDRVLPDKSSEADAPATQTAPAVFLNLRERRAQQ